MLADTNLNNIHRDVLYGPIPTDKSERDSFIEEIINRAKKTFSLKSYNDAELLYSRAISIDSNNDGDSCYKYYGNRSIIRCKIRKYELALQDADMVIQINSTSSKGYLRKAQALEGQLKNKKALQYYKLAKEKCLLSDNKLVVLIDKSITNLEDLLNKPIDDKNKINLPIPIIDSHNQNNSESDSEELDISLRGYRIRADGSKTTFFNHLMTDETKDLIGDITPKRL